MSAYQIPTVLNDYNVYNNGRDLIGISGATQLPDITNKSNTTSVAGGDVDIPVKGKYNAMSIDLNFRMLDTEQFTIMSGDNVNLTFRNSEQHINKSTAGVDSFGSRVVIKGVCSSYSPGKLESGTAMDSKIVVNITYIMIEVDGKKVRELDLLNGIDKINDVDQLAQIKKQT